MTNNPRPATQPIRSLLDKKPYILRAPAPKLQLSHPGEPNSQLRRKPTSALIRPASATPHSDGHQSIPRVPAEPPQRPGSPRPRALGAPHSARNLGARPAPVTPSHQDPSAPSPSILSPTPNDLHPPCPPRYPPPPPKPHHRPKPAEASCQPPLANRNQKPEPRDPGPRSRNLSRPQKKANSEHHPRPGAASGGPGGRPPGSALRALGAGPARPRASCAVSVTPR